MRPIRRLFIALGFFAAVCGSAAKPAKVEPYPLVPGDRASEDYRLAINGVAVPVVAWSKNFAYAHAALEPGAVHEVVVSAAEPVAEHLVSPYREKISATISGADLRFTLSGPRHLRVRVNALRTLLLFLDPPEERAPRPGDPGVSSIHDHGVAAGEAGVLTDQINRAIATLSAAGEPRVLYFPPGVYRAGTVILRSHVTLYLAPGALLKAADDPRVFHRDHPGACYRRLNFITAYQEKNCGIRGRGVIDGNATFLRPRLAELPPFTVVAGPGQVDANRIVSVQFSRVENGFVEGVISRNSSSWNSILHYCSDFAVTRYKVLSDMDFAEYKNEDALDIDSCQRLVVRDGFFVARDDAIVLKTMGVYPETGQQVAPDSGARDMNDVLVRNNLLWSETVGLKYGFSESQASTVHRLRFEENVVLNAREGVQIRTRGPARFRDAVFRGNWYEDIKAHAGGRSRNYWLDDPEASDLLFIDERHAQFGPFDSVIKGSQIRFENIWIAGELRTDFKSARFAVEGTHVSIGGPVEIPFAPGPAGTGPAEAPAGQR